MISSLSELNRYALPTNPTTGQGTSFDARAPEGYQGSSEGLAAGQRVQTGAHTETSADNLPQRRPPQGGHPGPATAVVVDGGARAAAAAGSAYPVDAQARVSRGFTPAQGANSGNAGGQSVGQGNRLAAAQATAQSAAQAPRPGFAGPPTSPIGGDVSPTPVNVGGPQQTLPHPDAQSAQARGRDPAQAVAGQAATPNQAYEVGPDGRPYAAGGELNLDTTPVPGDPQATIEKMEAVKRAALSPATPSPEDRRVATKATLAEAEARRELAEAERAEREAKASADVENRIRLPGTDEDGNPLSATEVGLSSENPIADDFTAADVGRLREDPNAERDARAGSAGKVAASAISRARSELAFVSQPPGQASTASFDPAE